MESLQTALSKVQQTKSLQKSQQEDISVNRENNELSVYKSGKVDAETFAHGVKKIKAAFPRLSNQWFDLLDEMIDQSGFTNERFKDAVYDLIKNCVYPEPTIANLLSFDKKIKIFTYKESLEYGQKYLTAIDINGKPFWAKTEDVERFKLKKWSGTK